MRWDWDYAKHAGVGWVAGSVVILVGVTNTPIAAAVALFIATLWCLLIFGVLREWAQQEYRYEFSTHKWIEAVTWALGGVFAAPWFALY